MKNFRLFVAGLLAFLIAVAVPIQSAQSFGLGHLGSKGGFGGLGGGGSVALLGQRIVPDTSNSFYVMASTPRGVALAYHFIRNAGGSSGTDVGTPWQPWRLSGVFEFSGIGRNPLTDTPLYTWVDDTGAQNYAVQLGAKFAGSYHGGETTSAQTVKLDGVNADPTLASAIGKSVAIAHTSTVTDGTNSYTVDFSLTVNTDGSVTSTMNSIASAATFGKWYVGMVIAAQAYDEAWVNFSGALTGTQYKVPVSVGTQTYGRTYLAAADTVKMRKSSDGRIIRVVSNAPSISGYRRTSIVRDTGLNRSKLYYEFTGGVPGTKTGITWTNYYETGAAGATTFASNLLTNGDFASNITGWTTNQNPGGVAWNAGKLRQTRSAETRTIQGASVTINVPYLMAGEDTFTGASYLDPGSLAFSNNSNGSLSSPVADYGTVPFDQNGYNAHIVVPTATATRYVMMQFPAQSGGSSVSDTADWDNMSLIQIGQ
jgi:hypothetical protein